MKRQENSILIPMPYPKVRLMISGFPHTDITPIVLAKKQILIVILQTENSGSQRDLISLTIISQSSISDMKPILSAITSSEQPVTV